MLVKWNFWVLRRAMPAIFYGPQTIPEDRKKIITNYCLRKRSKLFFSFHDTAPNVCFSVWGIFEIVEASAARLENFDLGSGKKRLDLVHGYFTERVDTSPKKCAGSRRKSFDPRKLGLCDKWGIICHLVPTNFQNNILGARGGFKYRGTGRFVFPRSVDLDIMLED